ncbi:MAG: hypothetical protein LBE38_09385 [Deltaproteobacteria bacterium]|jgi:hypothetical protein|nr:hypothetical protein [Deltaproteobacteria bacterium]
MLYKFSIVGTLIVIILTAAILNAQSLSVLPPASGLNWVPFEYKGQPQNVTVMVPDNYVAEEVRIQDISMEVFQSPAFLNNTFDDNILLTLGIADIVDMRNSTGTYDDFTIEIFVDTYINDMDNILTYEVTQDQGLLILEHVSVGYESLDELLTTTFEIRRIAVKGEITVMLVCIYDKDSQVTEDILNDTDFKRINNEVCSPYFNSLTFN